MTVIPMFRPRPHQKPSGRSMKRGKGDPREKRVNSGLILKAQSGHDGTSKQHAVFDSTSDYPASMLTGQRQTLKQLSYVIREQSARIINNRQERPPNWIWSKGGTGLPGGSG
jgi:hypothetical protein